MADYISMKQVPGGTVTAVDDRILYDYAINSGIIYGCEISYTGNNMIHINAGYGIIKGGLFEIEDHTEYVEYSESPTGTSGQIYLHFDAAAEDKLTIVKETTDALHPMIKDENANYDNGIYEIQICTFRATTTALTNVRQTFVHATMPVDVLDNLADVLANTNEGKAAGALAVKQLSGGLQFSLIDGKPAWKEVGADSFNFFNLKFENAQMNDVTTDKGTVIANQDYRVLFAYQLYYQNCTFNALTINGVSVFDKAIKLRDAQGNIRGLLLNYDGKANDSIYISRTIGYGTVGVIIAN